MNIEETSLEARAARHAALADPARLRMMDLLERGDYSPQELRDHLSMASNLLSHHLKVLEGAGLIARTRSEGDRRRTYVHLAAHPESIASHTGPIEMSRVVFVCTANSARSQLAEHIWRSHSSIPATSAGTLPADAVAPGAVKIAAAHGMNLSHVSPRLLSDVAQDGDFRITVCDNAHELLGLSDLHWSIPDPVSKNTAAAFRQAYNDLSRRIDALIPQAAAA